MCTYADWFTRSDELLNRVLLWLSRRLAKCHIRSWCVADDALTLRRSMLPDSVMIGEVDDLLNVGLQVFQSDPFFGNTAFFPGVGDCVIDAGA
jgi:hypothetical protein